MADQAVKLVSALSTVNATHASLETFFAQIDDLEKNVRKHTHAHHATNYILAPNGTRVRMVSIA